MAFFRPSEGEARRREWQCVHKAAGRVAVLGGLANVSLGVFIVNGPQSVWVAWFVLLGGLVCGAGVLEVALQLRRVRLRRLGLVEGEGSVGGADMQPLPSHDVADAEVLIGSPALPYYKGVNDSASGGGSGSGGGGHLCSGYGDMELSSVGDSLTSLRRPQI